MHDPGLTDSVKVRGAFTRSSISRGPLWHSLVVSTSHLEIRHWPLRALRLERDDVSTVRLRRVRLLFWWGTNVRFVTTSMGTSRYVFSPFRPKFLESALRDRGWPVRRDKDVTPGSLLRRASRRHD